MWKRSDSYHIPSWEAYSASDKGGWILVNAFSFIYPSVGTSSVVLLDSLFTRSNQHSPGIHHAAIHLANAFMSTSPCDNQQKQFTLNWQGNGTSLWSCLTTMTSLLLSATYDLLCEDPDHLVISQNIIPVHYVMLIKTWWAQSREHCWAQWCIPESVMLTLHVSGDWSLMTFVGAQWFGVCYPPSTWKRSCCTLR